MTPFTLKDAAPVVLRIGISLVFLWFGSQQLLHTNSWTGMIPQFILDFTGLTATTLVHFNGAFEIVFGLCLFLGYFTSVSSLLLALHMIHIMITVGYSSIGVRDFGLSVAAVAVFLYGSTRLSLDKIIRERQLRNQ